MPTDLLTEALVLLAILLIYARLPALVPATVPFGVRIPLDRAADPRVAAIRRAYYARLAIGAVAIGLVVVLAGSALDAAAGRVVRALALLLLAWGNYYGAHRRLAALKQREGWYAGRRTAVIADLQPRRWPRGEVVRGSVPAVGLLLLMAGIGVWRYPALPATLAIRFTPDGAPLAWGAPSPWVVFGPLLIPALLTILLIAGAWLTWQTPQALDVEEPDVSRDILGRRARGLTRGILWLAAWVTVAQLLGVLQIGGLVSGPVGRLSTAALLMGVLGLVGFSVGWRRAVAPRPAAAPPQLGGPINRDDDRFWIAGVFYWNPTDPAIIVNRRFGLGWTLNHARPAAWVGLLGVCAAVIFALILGLPLHLRGR